jgi:hypothetical protein
MRKEGKALLFEKISKKIFKFGRALGQRPHPANKVFWFFFSKKNRFLSLRSQIKYL